MNCPQCHESMERVNYECYTDHHRYHQIPGVTKDDYIQGWFCSSNQTHESSLCYCETKKGLFGFSDISKKWEPINTVHIPHKISSKFIGQRKFQ